MAPPHTTQAANTKSSLPGVSRDKWHRMETETKEHRNTAERLWSGWWQWAGHVFKDIRAHRTKREYGEGEVMRDLAKERVILLPRNTYGSCFISVIEVRSQIAPWVRNSSTAMCAVIIKINTAPVSQEQGRRQHPSKRLPREAGRGNLPWAEKAGPARDCLDTYTLLAYCKSIRLGVLSKLHC